MINSLGAIKVSHLPFRSEDGVCWVVYPALFFCRSSNLSPSRDAADDRFQHTLDALSGIPWDS